MSTGTAERLLSYAELEAGLDAIRQSPPAAGTLELIVRRPVTEQREVLATADLDLERGLVGDRWFDGVAGRADGAAGRLDGAAGRLDGAAGRADGAARRLEQLTVMNARAIALLAGTRERWPLAGDQLYVDLDLSQHNLPPGARLAIGAAVIEVSPEPHTGCRKFRERYGLDAVRFVGSAVGKALQLRGINAWVVVPGAIRVGDAVRKL